MYLGNFLAQLAILFSPLMHHPSNGGGSNHNCPAATSIDRPYTILVEGNVGSGKSTLLEALGGRPDVLVVPEPVEEWQNVNGTDLLDKVYEAQVTEAFVVRSKYPFIHSWGKVRA